MLQVPFRVRKRRSIVGATNSYPNNEATLLPSPSMPLRPAGDDPVEKRWQAPSNLDETPIALPRRFASTP
jgi:hypothetical protein